MANSDQQESCGDTCQTCPAMVACHSADQDGPDVDPAELLALLEGTHDLSVFINPNNKQDPNTEMSIK